MRESIVVQTPGGLASRGKKTERLWNTAKATPTSVEVIISVALGAPQAALARQSRSP